MIDNIFFSIAGKKANTAIDEILDLLVNDSNCPAQDKVTLEYSIRVAKEGTYPDSKYYTERGYEPIRTTKSIAEIKVLTQNVREEWSYEALRRDVVESVSTTGTAEDLKSRLAKTLDSQYKGATSLKDYLVQVDSLDRSKTGDGFTLNISELDQVTGGLQDGTVATIAAFTGHGKSTLAISATYKNIKQGKTGVVFSLEVTPKLVIMQFYSRWLFEEKGVEITPKAMMDGTLDDSQREVFEKYRGEFNEFITGRVLILDESVLDRDILSNFRDLNRVYKAAEEIIPSVDFVIFDHVGQVELLFEGMGNRFVKTLTSSTKTFLNAKGRNPVSIMCVQTNRQGLQRAQRRNGKYDLQAISDLNEVERSSFYCIFMYTSDDMKLLQETKVMLLKHRLGALVTEPVSISFNPAVFVVGETVETVSFLGNLSFLNDSETTYESDAFDDFE